MWLGKEDEKLREHQFTEGFIRCAEGKRADWDEGRNVEKIWDQVK